MELPFKFGKQVGGDILQNKKTYLLLSAFEKSDATQKAQLEALLSGNLKGEEKISAFIELFNQLNVPQHAQSAMQTYFDTGMQALNKIQEVKPEAKKGLVDLAEVLMGNSA